MQRVFAGTWLSYAGLYLCRRNFSVLMPLLATQLAFSRDNLAQLVFAYSLAYCIGQFLNGALADAVDARWVVGCGMLLSAGATAAMAGGGGVGLFLMLQVLNGVGQSAGWPGLLKITAAAFDPAQRGVIMAWWSTNYVVGGFVATILATWLVTSPVLPGLEWKRGALGPALLLLGITVLFGVLLRTTHPPRAHAAPAAAAGAAWSEVLSSPALWSIAVAYFCLKLMRYTFLFWLPLYMVERLHYANGEAGYTSSIYELIGFAGVPLAGYLSDRWLNGRRFPAAAGMMFLLALACLAFPALSGFSRIGNWVAIGLVGMLTFGPDSLLAGPATQEAVSRKASATAGGFVNGVGSLGQLLSPLLVAQAVKTGGWDGLFSAFTALSVAGGIAVALRWQSDRGRVITAPVAAQ